MYKIAICDDEISTCGEIEQYVIAYFKKKLTKVEVDVFYTGDEICSKLTKQCRYNTIFLDIELSDMNGIEIGQLVRNQLNDEQTNLIFISSKESYAISLFKSRPIDFLVKPVTEDTVNEVLKVITKRENVQSMFLECLVGKVTEKISLSDILYLRSDNKIVSIVLTNGDKKNTYAKLADLVPKLPEEVFLCIHKSYVINCRYVSKFTYEWVEMINGDILSVSKTNRKEVKQKLLEGE